MYYNMKMLQYRAAQSAYAYPVGRMMHLKQNGVCIEKFKTQREELLMRSIFDLCDSLSFFLLTVLNVSYCALGEFHHLDCRNRMKHTVWMLNEG